MQEAWHRQVDQFGVDWQDPEALEFLLVVDGTEEPFAQCELATAEPLERCDVLCTLHWVVPPELQFTICVDCSC